MATFNKFETTKIETSLNLEFGKHLNEKLLVTPEELVSYDTIFNAINERGSSELKEIYGLSDEQIQTIMGSASTEVLVKSTLAYAATVEWFGAQKTENEEEMKEAVKVFAHWNIETGINMSATWFSNLYLAKLIDDITYFKAMQMGWVSREVLLDSLETQKEPVVANYIAKAKEMKLSPEVQEMIPHFASVMARYTM